MNAETATRGVLVELFDTAVAEHTGRARLAGNAERRAAPVEQLAGLDEERRGYLQLATQGRIEDHELDGLLSDVAERHDAIVSEMRRAEEVVEETRRIEEARSLLLAEDWREDPDHLGPEGWFMYEAAHSGGATPEQVRAAYMRYGTRFELDAEGSLKLTMDINLGAEHVANGSHIHGNEHWEFGERGLMRRRDASINAYKIDESERRYRWERPGEERA